MDTLSWQAQTVQANGLNFQVERAGQGEPVLLIMGLGAQLTLWPESFCTRLIDAGFEVIRFDNRDIGLSDTITPTRRLRMLRDTFRNLVRLPIQAEYTLHDMQADTLGVMDALGLERVHLIGVSMGGMISQLLAAKASERIQSLNLIMTSTNHPNLPLPDLPVIKELIGLGPKDHSREGVIKRGLKFWGLTRSPLLGNDPTLVAERIGRDFDRAYNPHGIARQTHAVMATGSIEEAIKAIQTPTLVIHGDKDRLLKLPAGRRCAKLNPQARLEIIEGMGHDLPEKLIPTLCGLIIDHARSAAR